MRCAYCGKKLRETAKFCPYCGKSNDGNGSEFAEKFDSKDGLFVVKAQEIFRSGKAGKPFVKDRRLPIIYIIVPICAVLLCAAVYAAVKYAVPEASYVSAQKLYIAGEFSEAEKEFARLGDYKDSEAYVLKCGYENALELMNSGLFPEAADAFTSLDGYADSDRLAAECMLEIAGEYAENGDLEAAASVYAAAGKPGLIRPAAEKKAASLAENEDYFGAAEISEKYADEKDALEYRYKGASRAKENGDFKTAADNFYLLGNYKNSSELAEICAYSYFSSEYEKNGAAEETARGFYFLGDFRDSHELFRKVSYEYGEKCLENGDCFTAAAMFRNAGSYGNSTEMLYKARYALGVSLLEDDPASARSVFALLSTYSDSSKKKKAAADKLAEKESWYADGFTSVDGYFTSVFGKDDILLVSCSAGTDSISPPAELTLTLRDSSGKEVSADCGEVRNSGFFSVSLSLKDVSAGTAEITVSRSGGAALRTFRVTIVQK